MQPILAIPIRLLIWIGLVLLALLISTILLIIGQTTLTSLLAYKKEKMRESVRLELLRRLDEDPSNWQSWLTQLNRTERSVLEDVLISQITNIRGEEKNQLQTLAQAAGIDQRAQRLLKTGTRREKLRALTLLELLEIQVPPEVLVRQCGRHKTTRAGAAKLLNTQGYPEAKQNGMELLLRHGEPLSQEGMDVLFELNKNDPDDLLHRAQTAHSQWDRNLLIQVFSVIAECSPTNNDQLFDWVIQVIHDNHLDQQETERLRAMGLRTLQKYGWSDHIRSSLNLRQALQDFSPRVRRAAYELVDEWGDKEAIDMLVSAVEEEENDRLLLAGARALHGHQNDVTLPSSSEFNRAWDWVTATSVRRYLS